MRAECGGDETVSMTTGDVNMCVWPCSDADGGYMDMNKEESVQYVTMKELSFADIKPAVYETPYTAAGVRTARLSRQN